MQVILTLLLFLSLTSLIFASGKNQAVLDSIQWGKKSRQAFTQAEKYSSGSSHPKSFSREGQERLQKKFEKRKKERESK